MATFVRQCLQKFASLNLAPESMLEAARHFCQTAFHRIWCVDNRMETRALKTKKTKVAIKWMEREHSIHYTMWLSCDWQHRWFYEHRQTEISRCFKHGFVCQISKFLKWHCHLKIALELKRHTHCWWSWCHFTRRKKIPTQYNKNQWQ